MLKSFTSPTIEDIAFDDDGSYSWDCYNIDLCKSSNKPGIKKHGCLKGSTAPRCSIEEKYILCGKYPHKKVKSFPFPTGK